jgi:ABC-type glycerol-3-phosphate transport system substrate-binding protein
MQPEGGTIPAPPNHWALRFSGVFGATIGGGVGSAGVVRGRGEAWALRRRDLLRAGCACLVGAAALQGCGPERGAAASTSRARPQGSGGGVTLTASIGYQGAATYAGTQRELVDDYIAQHFSARHPGVRVATAPAPNANGNPASAATVIAAVLAGGGPDVLAGSGYQLASFLEQDLLAPLEALVRAAGIDLTGFDPSHVAALTRPGTGLIGLPAWDGPDAVLVNWSMLDGLGLPRPGPGWTYDEAATLWRQVAASRGATHIWGMGLDLHDYFARLFGGQLMNAAGTRCLLDSAAVLQAADWLVPLVLEGAVQPIGTDVLVTERVAATGMGGGGRVQTDLVAMQALQVEWDWLPMPLFPQNRRYTYNNSDWYGLNALSTHPRELVWELLQFLVLDPGFAQLMFRTTFVPPNQRSLWPAWMAAVRAAAPVLRTKHLEYFEEATAYGVCDQDFAVHPYQADTILQHWLTLVFTGAVAPAAGLAQCAAAINTLEAGGTAAGSGGQATQRG